MSQNQIPDEQEHSDEAPEVVAPRDPLFGFMKGMLTIPPGVDLTAPTCPDWEAYAEKKYGPDSELGKLWAKVVERENQRGDT